MNDRIKLAEAMRRSDPVYLDPRIEKWENLPKFDPFTNANDDYAVLEWMLQKVIVPTSLFSASSGEYKIGDYARAALKVIDNV